jgi:AraC-like DNA-binding protein
VHVPIKCRYMSDTRHVPVAVTGTRRLSGGAGITAHRHDEHQIVYASRGVLSVATGAGVWIAPATRAIWVPAGTAHEHRAYGATVLHTVGLPVAVNPLRTRTPTVLAVSPLLRELLIAYAGSPSDGTPARRRLRAVLLDQLRSSPERTLHIPAPRDPRLVELGALLADDPADADTLRQLATRIGSSARTLSRLCREEFGMTFPQWRTQLRLHRALQLLADDVPVAAVAHRCGWAGSSAFIDVFRRTMGYTPGRRVGRSPSR